MELGVGETVVLGVLPRTRDQPGITFHAHHFRRRARQWQGEVAKAAEQVQHALAGLHVEQCQRARDHLFVEGAIDLDEIERPEQQFHIPGGEVEGELRWRHVIQRMHRIQSLGLQVDGEILGCGEIAQLLQVAFRQRLEMTEDQRTRLVARDEFDLRQHASRLHRIHQLREGRDLHADFRHHRVAFADVGDEARILLAETDQRLVLLLDAAHRETPLAPIAPRGIHQRRQHLARRHVADALQVLHQHALLGVDLLVLGQVLQHAAAAHPEMRATGRDAIRRGFQHLERLGFVETARARGLLDHHRLALQRAGNEHGLALMRTPFAAGDAAAIVAEVEDAGLERRLIDACHGRPESKRACIFARPLPGCCSAAYFLALAA